MIKEQGRYPEYFSPEKRIKKKNSGLNIIASRKDFGTYRSQGTEHNVCILILESYLNEVSQSISQDDRITETSYAQLPSMRKILADCMSITDISLEFFRLVETSLELIKRIFESNSSILLSELMKLLLRIFDLVATHGYLSRTVSIPIRGNKSISIKEGMQELKKRIVRITPRIINVWRKILTSIKELEQVCYGFLKFYSEVDGTIPNINIEDPIASMHLYGKNPGHVVQTVRKTIVFLEGEMISVRVAREVHEIQAKVSPEVVGCIDKTMSGFMIWDLIRTALEYYKLLALYHYNVDIFDKDLIVDDHEFKFGKQNRERIERRKKFRRVKEKSKSQDFESSSPTVYEIEPQHNSFVQSFDNSVCDGNEFYESYILERFREFLIEKLKQETNEPQNLNLQKSALLEEFNEHMQVIDQKSISKLWNR